MQSYLIAFIALTLLSTTRLIFQGKFDEAMLVICAISWTLSAAKIDRNILYTVQILIGLFMLVRLSVLKHLWGKFNLSPIFLIFAIYVAYNSVLNKVPMTGFVRISLMTILIAYLLRLNSLQLSMAIKHILFLQTLVCLSIFTKSNPRVSVGIDLKDGSEIYSNLVGHPNYLAYIAVFNGLLFIVYFNERLVLKNLGLLLNVLCIIYTQCRSAFIALVLGVIFILIDNQRRITMNYFSSKSKRSSITIFLLAGVIIILSPIIDSRFLQFSQSGGFTGANSFGWRILQWKTALDVIGGRLVFGVGWQNGQSFLLGGLKAHNSFIQVALELGVLGLFLYLFIIARFSLFLFKVPYGKPFFWLLLVSSSVDAGIFYPALAFYLLVTLSFLEKINMKVKEINSKVIIS